MKYLSEILWLVSWPILIYFCYKISEVAINRYRKVEEKRKETDRP
ncbi:hypothetical protein [uncultured Acetobacteroides sp.]|nr:hypothetical protein [uncultured Acetobacteroides sp.]